jgi:hypothetical protein
VRLDREPCISGEEVVEREDALVDEVLTRNARVFRMPVRGGGEVELHIKPLLLEPGAEEVIIIILGPFRHEEHLARLEAHRLVPDPLRVRLIRVLIVEIAAAGLSLDELSAAAAGIIFVHGMQSSIGCASKERALAGRWRRRRNSCFLRLLRRWWLGGWCQCLATTGSEEVFW